MKKEKDYILIGDLFTTFFNTTLNTLQVSFLLRDKSIFQLINLSALIISAIINKIIIPKQSNQEKFYKHRKTFFIIESIIDIVLILPIIVLRDKSIFIVGIIAILTKPITEIQSINNTIFTSKIFSKESRLIHDLKTKEKMSTIKIAAAIAGFVATKVIPPYIAYAIILVVEAVNNVFYMAQKPMTGGDN